MTKPVPILPSLQVQLNCLRVLQSPQLTLEFSLLVQSQLDHISANLLFCQHRLLLSFSPWELLSTSTEKSTITIIMSPLGNHVEVIYVPKIYNWFSKPNGPCTSTLRMTFLTQNAACLLPKTLIPQVALVCDFPLRAGLGWLYMNSLELSDIWKLLLCWALEVTPHDPSRQGPAILWGCHLQWLLPSSIDTICLLLLVPCALVLRIKSGSRVRKTCVQILIT